MENPNILKLKNDLEAAIKNEDEVMIYNNNYDIGKEYIKIRNDEQAFNYLNKALELAVGVNKKMEVNLSILLIHLKNKNIDESSRLVKICKGLLVDGADWEKKNKLKTYEGIYCIMIRDFNNAALLLLSSISTFDSDELISFENLVFYSTFLSFISLNRSDIKKDIIENSEVISELNSLPEINSFIMKFYKCNYNNIFVSFIEIFKIVKNDFYLKDHYNYLTKKGKVVIFKQYLDAFKTVTLDNISLAFNLNKDFLEKELANLISSKMINCKIDKISEIIESQEYNNKNNRYQSLIKKGDNLINKLQKWSKVVEV